LDNKEIERQWKCAIDFIAKRNDDDNKNGSTTKNTNTISPEEQEEELLAEENKLTSEDIAFVISTIKEDL
jgi:hypothetical protein